MDKARHVETSRATVPHFLYGTLYYVTYIILILLFVIFIGLFDDFDLILSFFVYDLTVYDLVPLSKTRQESFVNLCFEFLHVNYG